MNLYRLKVYLRNIDMWLPAQGNCGHWVWHKHDLHHLDTTWGKRMFVCPSCYRKEKAWDKK